MHNSGTVLSGQGLPGLVYSLITAGVKGRVKTINVISMKTVTVGC